MTKLPGSNPEEIKLSPEHYATLVEGSGISPEIVQQRGYRTITDPKELRELGFARQQTLNVPGLLLPVHCTDGTNGLATYRPDIPRTVEDRRRRNSDGTFKTRVIKYEIPKHAAMRLDVPRACRARLADPTVALWITEGQKKADALASRGLCALALLGVWNFKGRNAFGGVTWLADWDYVALPGRDVLLVFDSDVMAKPEVRAALDRLTEHLQRKSAHVAAVYLPQEAGHKVGVDDYLLSHTLEELEGLIEGPRPRVSVAAPIIELLEVEPLTIRRPIALVDDRSYVAVWPYIKVTVTETTDEKGNIVKLESPEVVTERQLCIVRDDGRIFGREVNGKRVGDESLADLGINIFLNEIPSDDRLWSVPSINKYRAGERPRPADVFTRLADIVDRFIDFDRSFAEQRTMSEMVACYILTTWFLDAFNVIGYLWPNGEKGSGKTQLLMIVAELSHLGQVILSGGSFASLRDLADYGATIAFDDAEPLADPNNKNNEEKRALLLAGNRRGAKVPVKEIGPTQQWRTRYINNFSPRLFSAIRIPDPVLASRTIIVPLVKTADRYRGNADALDYAVWPHDRRQLIDDCWALSLAHIRELRRYEALVNEKAELTGRNLEPWRALLAVALWLSERGVEDLWKRIHKVSLGYQGERQDMESTDLTRLVILALEICLRDAECEVLRFCEVSPEGGSCFLKTQDITEAVKELVERDEIGIDLDKVSSRRIGWILKRLRLRKHREPGTGKYGWLLRRPELEKYFNAFGLISSEETSQNPKTSQAENEKPNERLIL